MNGLSSSGVVVALDLKGHMPYDSLADLSSLAVSIGVPGKQALCVTTIWLI